MPDHSSSSLMLGPGMAPPRLEGSATDGSLTVSNVMKEIQVLKDKFKNDDEDHFSPYQDLEKASVLQECRVFHDANIVTQDPRLCCQLITKLLHILSQGEQLTSVETTTVFFGVTKLFQSHNSNLRRMMYLFIKEMAEACNPDDVIIVTSSLTKDMNSREDLYRANAIRVLSKIIDSTMLGAIERYMKQAIVDKNPMVAASALVAGLQLMHKSPEIVRRWVNEVQEAVNSPHEMVQAHALALLYEIKHRDRLAVSKLVLQLSRGSLRSPLAICSLIRYIVILVHDDPQGAAAKAGLQFVEGCLRHKNEIVMYEAAKAICRLPGVEARDLGPAITVLQLFLASPRPAFRFCAMRTLSEVALTYPVVVTKCNDDMEALLSDANRSIGTLAITTLLKTGEEGSVDRLMKQISTYMNDIADEFKILIVQSIKQLCLKYPHKHALLLGFLANFLREEGGYEYKKAITEAIVSLMDAIPLTKDASLFHLCEFIEDCEFTDLSTQILHLIGDLGPTAASPARYIRFVYNRVILENAVVRAAAVSTLAKFAVKVPSLRPSICVLLQRSLQDEDDEVRDRVTLSLSLLNPTADPSAASLLVSPLPLPWHTLERAVTQYTQHAAAGKPLTFQSLPVVEDLPPPPALLPIPSPSPLPPSSLLRPRFSRPRPAAASSLPITRQQGAT
uniref:Gamma-coat protein n=2 Tax=Nannochloropsis gaditana TaxID=72520 RepID=I2CP15_NANGC